MERRDVLRLLATAAALPFIPTQLLGVLREARAEAASAAAPRTLNPHQYASVTRMAEVILPETDTPGATSAGVPQFIDLILTEWSQEDERARFLAGLADVDALAHRRAGADFVDCTPEQQHDVVQDLDQAMIAEMVALKDAASQGARHDPLPTHNFFFMMKQLTLTGYYTSEAGAQQELHFKIVTVHYDGCVPADNATPSK